MKALPIGLALAGAASIVALAQTPQVRKPASAPAVAKRINIPYVDAKSIIDALQEDLLPAALRAKPSAERARLWPGWVTSRDRTIRARVAQGDEDSIFNFLLFGTTFTSQPRVPDILDSVTNASTAQVVQRRLDDMVTGLASPGSNERLQLVRDVVDRTGIKPATPEGKFQARLYLVDIIGRVVREREGYELATGSASQADDPLAKLATHSTLYRNRGLSSDTSIFPSFAVEETLRAIRAAALLGDAPVRRVAIIGPGLDFVDKEEGYDFYPLQTIQPFSTIDSLIRLGFATPNDLRVTTFDLSSRVNRHLQTARQRAGAGGAYQLALPRNQDEHWNPALLAYWQRMGDRIGEETQAAAAPSNAGNVQVRSLRVRPAFVMSITAEDANVVLQRLEQPDPRERFDLIIATNVLVYYDVFEQSLALANLATMLRRGGLFLSNNLIRELPATPMDSAGFTDVGYTDSGDGDRILWYQRR